MYNCCHYSPLVLLEILALALGPMVETQLDQIMHKVPLYNQQTLYTVNSTFMHVTSIVPLCSSLLQAHLSLLPLQQKVLYPSNIGLYPVHLHRLPNS